MKLPKFLALSVAGAVSANAWAIDEPRSMNIWGFEFTPTLAVSESYDDNIRALRDEEKTSSWITSINPTFLLSAEDRNSAYQLEYSFNSDIYHSDSEATNTDHHLVFRSIMEFTSRHRLAWNLQYHRVEEVADVFYWENDNPVDGDNSTEYVVSDDENDKFSRSIAGATYTFGAREARNQIEVGANYEARRYFNGGGLNDDREFDSVQLNTVWYHALGARTKTLLEGRVTDYDYVNDTSRRSSTNYALLGGATWDATAKTKGNIRLGAQRKNFEDSTRSDYTTPMWEASVSYSPRTYSTFTLASRRAFDEGDDGASTVRNQTTSLGWKHEWSPFIRTELEYRLADREYKSSGRNDDLTGYGAGVIYSPVRWVDVSLGYRRLDNDSNDARRDYTRNIYLLGLELSL
ncbi:outer membrane beta-barrel protein [Pseudomonas matsuisoli]|uniref:Beta-barrel porin 2 n=1 Tax=Pseudomonas matsuisoli TaxID=1515666 RepID=A0A917Q1G5_9PSED|nr:outer membrane beta-barrel protein [Pseudomonas matsuisoli]GGK05554.1 hypothetical protein GCM10009304_34600 [Pseudomonas matsuisoli]